MIRNVALVAAALTSAAVLATGLSLAGFGPAPPGGASSDVPAVVPSGGSTGLSAIELDRVLAAAGVAAGARVVVIHPDGTIDDLVVADVADTAAPSRPAPPQPAAAGVDALLDRLADRLEHGA